MPRTSEQKRSSTVFTLLTGAAMRRSRYTISAVTSVYTARDSTQKAMSYGRLRGATNGERNLDAGKLAGPFMAHTEHP